MLQFLQENLMLLAVIVIAVVALALPMLNAKRFAPEVAPKDAVDMINKRKAQVVDIRKASEFKRGHIVGSVNYPADHIQTALGQLDRKRPIILVDQTGAGSRPAAKLLRGTGFEEVYILETGLIGWLKEKMPLE